MDTAILEIEAQETAALLADEQPQPRGRIGAFRAASILGAGALAAVGAKTFWHSKVQASPEGIVVLSGSGTSGVCSHNGFDCRDTKCCIDPASKCYQKNEHWSSCNATCSTDTMWNGGWVTTDDEEEQWSCKETKRDAGAYALEKGTCCCPKEDEVKSEDACHQALHFMALLLGFGSEAEELSWSGTYENIPPGCSFKLWPDGKSGRGHWNTDDTGKGKARDNMIPICFNAAGPEAASEAEGNGEEEVEQGSKAVECSAAGVSCAESKCCTDAYHRCYQKTDGWASCNASCSSKMKWVDGKWAEQEEDVWDCKELGSKECSAAGESCAESKCCTDAYHKCYQKTDGWASCNASCSSKMKWVDGKWAEQEEDVWDCKELGSKECSAAGESCAESKCCTDAYHKCYQKTDGWASCNASCSSKMKWVDGKWAEQEEHVWDCKELMSDAPSSTVGQTAQDICVKAGENCMLSKCCLDAGHTCYKKDDHWASCNSTCSSNSEWVADGWVDTGEKVWECDELVHDDVDSEKSFCDMSGCDVCGGGACMPCREETERDCCLTDMCKTLEGDELTSCQSENLQTCCEGKSDHCTSSA